MSVRKFQFIIVAALIFGLNHASYGARFRLVNDNRHEVKVLMRFHNGAIEKFDLGGPGFRDIDTGSNSVQSVSMMRASDEKSGFAPTEFPFTAKDNEPGRFINIYSTYQPSDGDIVVYHICSSPSIGSNWDRCGPGRMIQSWQ